MAAMDFTLEDVDPDSLESGGKITQPGWYTAIVDDAYTERKHGESECIELVVNRGPFSGSRVFYYLGHHDAAEDAEKAKKAKTRMLATAKRLGLITEEQVKHAKETGSNLSFEFSAAIGREVWVEMESGKAADGSPRVQCAYLAIHALDGDKVPPEMRRSIGLNVPDAPPVAGGNGRGRKRGGAGGGAEQKPATNQDFSDL